MTIKIQLALDMFDIQHAVEVATDVAEYVDIIELGTPLMKSAGIRGVMTMRDAFPHHLVLADLKTMDAGQYESSPFYEAGADICTVLGAADDDTIKGVIKAARQIPGKMAQVDLINVPNKVDRAIQVCEFGADIVGIHTGIDQQLKGQSPLQDLQAVARAINPFRISVAGGIKILTLPSIAEQRPGIIVVGGGITSLSSGPVRTEMARQMKLMVSQYV